MTPKEYVIKTKEAFEAIINNIKEFRKQKRRKKYLVDTAWDFQNLGFYWGLEKEIIAAQNEDVNSEDWDWDADAKPIKNFLDRAIQKHFENGCMDYNRKDEDCDCGLKEIADDIRLFMLNLAADSEKWDFYSPAWFGIRQIRDDYTLVKFVAHNIGFMWS